MVDNHLQLTTATYEDMQMLKAILMEAGLAYVKEKNVLLIYSS